MSKHTPEQVQYVANTLMPNFIPKDKGLCDLAFAFTMDGVNYEVTYRKDEKDDWLFISHQKANS